MILLEYSTYHPHDYEWQSQYYLYPLDCYSLPIIHCIEPFGILKQTKKNVKSRPALWRYLVKKEYNGIVIFALKQAQSIAQN